MTSFALAIPLIFLLATGCSGPYSDGRVSAKDAERSTPVRVETVALQSIPELISATGELLAEDAATISAKVPGRVAKLHVDLGSQVEAGQVLAELERDDYEVRVKQVEALVEQARALLGIARQPGDEVNPEETAIVRQAAASLKEAQLMFSNTTRLFKDGIVSKVDFERGQVNLQAVEARYQASLEQVAQVRAQLSERRAQLALARQNLADCLIRAPFPGGITRRMASTGEYLAVNAPLVMLVRQHPLRLRLEVPERYAARVRIGQRVEVRLQGSTASRAGNVVRISPSIEAQNRSLLIEGEIPNQDGVLRAGSFAEGTITVDANARGIAVPAAAVSAFAGTERVLLVSGGTLAERVVRTGRRMAGNRVEVVTGLEPGEQVVREANDRMAKGQRVTTGE